MVDSSKFNIKSHMSKIVICGSRCPGHFFWKINSTNLGFFHSSTSHSFSRQPLRTYLTVTNFVVHHYTYKDYWKLHETFALYRTTVTGKIRFLSFHFRVWLDSHEYVSYSLGFLLSPLFMHFSFRTLILSRFGPHEIFRTFMDPTDLLNFLMALLPEKSISTIFLFASNFP